MGARLNRRELHTTSRQIVLDEAAKHFSRNGYEAASMRAISASLGITASALYNHFRSKEDIYCAAYDQGMTQIHQAVEDAIAGAVGPWERLEAMAQAHCSVLLNSESNRTIISPQFPKGLHPTRRAELIAKRDAYEALVKKLIDDLRLPEEQDPTVFRMHLLGAMNWSTTWFRPEQRISHELIGPQIVRTLRYGVQGKTERED